MDNDEELQCPCCKLFYSPGAPDWDGHRRAALHTQAGVCWDCVNHLGDSVEVRRARAQHHMRMLRREYDVMRKNVQSARVEVREMGYELAMRPVQTVVRIENLDQIVVTEARQERDDAYRRRDVAMGALSDLRLLHHKNPENRTHCICGEHYESCDMADIADRWGGVEWWEQSQAGRAFLGLRHSLKADHPALKDRDYFKNVYGA